MDRSRPKVKSFEIPKRLIYEAWEKVRANNGAPGVDAVSIAEFQQRETTISISCGTEWLLEVTSRGRCGRWRYQKIMEQGSGF